MISDFHAPRQHERGIFIPILHTSLKESIMEPIQVQAIRKILEDELRPAMGCTEPIAVAYTAALARELLGVFPQQLTVRCSGNIIM